MYEVWCTCESDAEPIPVDVDYRDGEGAVTVNLICPDCRENRRTEPEPEPEPEKPPRTLYDVLETVGMYALGVAYGLLGVVVVVLVVAIIATALI